MPPRLEWRQTGDHRESRLPEQRPVSSGAGKPKLYGRNCWWCGVDKNPRETQWQGDPIMAGSNFLLPGAQPGPHSKCWRQNAFLPPEGGVERMHSETPRSSLPFLNKACPQRTLVNQGLTCSGFTTAYPTRRRKIVSSNSL